MITVIRFDFRATTNVNFQIFAAVDALRRDASISSKHRGTEGVRKHVGDDILGHLHLLAQLGGGSGGGRFGSASIGGSGDGLGSHDDGSAVRDPIGGDGVLAGIGGERRLALGVGQLDGSRAQRKAIGGLYRELHVLVGRNDKLGRDIIAVVGDRGVLRLHLERHVSRSGVISIVFILDAGDAEQFDRLELLLVGSGLGGLLVLAGGLVGQLLLLLNLRLVGLTVDRARDRDEGEGRHGEHHRHETRQELTPEGILWLLVLTLLLHVTPPTFPWPYSRLHMLRHPRKRLARA